jgi:nitrous oxidase accessory protein
LRGEAVFIACAVLLVASVADGATVQVSSNLQAAIDAATSGDTLRVAPGAYDKITVTKSLNLVGNGSLITAGDRDACINVEADGVSISGFVVRNGFYGIKLNSVKGCRISNNSVMHCVQPGITLLYSDDNTITGNNASLNGLGGEGWYGIYLSNSNDNLIADNAAYGNGAYGINLFPSCNNNTIIGNVLKGNMYGLYMFTNCAGNLIESNVMSENTNSGLDLRFNCHDNRILNNTIQKNVVSGIDFLDSGQNLLQGNNISGNKRYGLQAQGSSDKNIIISNTISESQSGIFVESSGNQIYGNRFVDNAVQAEDRGKNSWNAGYPRGGNLWSDYQGKDEMKGPGQDIPGKDGLGDLPYRINEISKDAYPIMGNQVKQISIIEKSLSPEEARVGDSIAIKTGLKSKYSLSQVSVHAYSSGVEAEGYARLTPVGDTYQGSFSTALLDPGRYEIVLTARDARGYELKETLGEIRVVPRS